MTARKPGEAVIHRMRRSVGTARLGLLLLMGVVLAGVPASSGAWAKTARPGSSWASIARLPDWRGAWYMATGGQFSRGGVSGGDPPKLTAAGVAELKRADHAYFDEGVNPPLQNCLPDGMPHIMDYAFPIELYFTPGKVLVYTEAYGQVRWIYTDGRAHSEDLVPSYNGESVGHWEGQTLVVDTIGMIPETQLVISNNFLGVRHSEGLHVIERVRLVAPDTLEIRTTVDDPILFAAPWTTTKTWRRKRDRLHEAKEYVCSNNREPLDANGKQTFQFNPPPK